MIHISGKTVAHKWIVTKRNDLIFTAINKDLLEEGHEDLIFLDNFKRKLFMHTVNKLDLVMDHLLEVLWVDLVRWVDLWIQRVGCNHVSTTQRRDHATEKTANLHLVLLRNLKICVICLEILEPVVSVPNANLHMEEMTFVKN